MPKHSKKRIMETFKLSEISAVDRPAQQGATMTIMKRDNDGDNVVEKKAALTTETDGHSHTLIIEDGRGIATSGMTSYVNGHEHPWILGEDGQIIIGAAQGHTHEPMTMSKGDQTKEKEGMTTKKNDDKKTEEQGNPDVAKLTDQVADLQKRLDKADAISKLNDDQKAYFATLDDAGKDGFLAKSDDDKKAAVAEYTKAQSDKDPIVYKSTEGEIFRKSDDPRMVAIAKRADRQAEDLRKAREDGDKSRIEAFVKSDLANLPGTNEAKVSLVKAAESIKDEKERTEAINALKAQNAALAGSFRTIGTTNAPTAIEKADKDGAHEELDKLARKRMTEVKDEDYYTAYEKVAEAHPDLYTKAVGVS